MIGVNKDNVEPANLCREGGKVFAKAMAIDKDTGERVEKILEYQIPSKNLTPEEANNVKILNGVWERLKMETPPVSDVKLEDSGKSTGLTPEEAKLVDDPVFLRELVAMNPSVDPPSVPLDKFYENVLLKEKQAAEVLRSLNGNPAVPTAANSPPVTVEDGDEGDEIDDYVNLK
jgi:hypothetical protein